MPPQTEDFELPDLPEGWAETAMGAVARVVGGGTPDSKDPANFCESGGYAWLTPADLSNNSSMHVSYGKRNLSDQGLRTSSAKLMPSGSVLMSSRAPIGYVAVAANPISTNQGFKSFVCAAEGLQPEFVAYWLRYIRPLLEQMGSGTTFSEISGSRAKEIPLHFAPLGEQKRIVAKIDALRARIDAACMRLAKIPAMLKRFRQSVLAAACSGRLTEDWRAAGKVGEPTFKKRQNAVHVGTDRQLEQEGIYEVPPSWRWLRLQDLCEKITVGHVGPMAEEYVPDGVPFLRSQNVREFRFDPAGLKFISRRFHNALSKSALRPGDVVVVRSGNAGIACVIPDELQTANCADLVVIRPSPEVDADFACLFINSVWARGHVDSVKVGIAQGHFNIRSARRTPFPMPPLAEQLEVVRRVETLFKLADAIDKRIGMAMARAEKLTQSILTKAFRGELVPTEAELARREGRTYESASALLSRIASAENQSTKIAPPVRSSADRVSKKSHTHSPA